MAGRRTLRWWVLGIAALVTVGAGAPRGGRGTTRPFPILFATQVPVPADFTTIGSVFGNHRSTMMSTARGGDLHILYPDGTLRNLTQEAGYGVASGFQGANAIAVREPCVDWAGTKAVFSMVVGAPTAQFVEPSTRWQLYEVTGLGQGQTAAITKVPNQPAAYNNVSPCYAPDGRIVFTSDRPRGGESHLYPQRDEYEEAPTVSGLWSLNPANGDLILLDHSPSGNFTPFVDRSGRVIFTRWDHLQRDQQADADALDGDTYGTFNWSGEEVNAMALNHRDEVFPEPRSVRTDLLEPREEGHSFNHFFPWMVNPDGTELETLLHLGRHELHTYFNRSFNDDNNLREFIAEVSGRTNPNPLLNLLQVRERLDGSAGRFVGVDAPEFQTHAAGRVVQLAAPHGTNPDASLVTYLTHPDSGEVQDTAAPCNSGLYRNALPLSDGTLIAVHAGERSAGVAETRADANTGTRPTPGSRYQFRLTELVPTSGGCSGFLRYGAPLTAGIRKTLSYWDPDVLVSFNNVLLWELYPVEVRSRPVPTPPTAGLAAPELAAFAAAGVNPAAFRADLEARGLALIVSRNVTTRDGNDRQQPFNLRVPGGVSTVGAAGTIYDVRYLELFQGDLIRGIGGTDSPSPGRRVLAQRMHGPAVEANPPVAQGSPPASVVIAPDGSTAAYVPARRALSWQISAPDGRPVVRERYWLTFQPGEIRTCASCHGVNTADQADQTPPINPPEALRQLLDAWRLQQQEIFRDGFESGSAAQWGATVGGP